MNSLSLIQIRIHRTHIEKSYISRLLLFIFAKRRGISLVTSMTSFKSSCFRCIESKNSQYIWHNAIPATVLGSLTQSNGFRHAANYWRDLLSTNLMRPIIFEAALCCLIVSKAVSASTISADFKSSMLGPNLPLQHTLHVPIQLY